jgi:sugar phosphate isomerase/epimerase
LSCPGWTINETIDRGSAYGFGGIDFRGLGQETDTTRLPAFVEQLDQTRRRLLERDLVVPSLNSSVRLLTPDDLAWQVMLAEYGRHLDLADAVESRMIRVFPGPTPAGMGRSDAIALAQRRLGDLVSMSSSRRARPVIETHDHLCTARDAMDMIGGRPPEVVGVVWDARHSFRAGEAIAESLALLVDHMAHVHLKDDIRMEKDFKPVVVGTGEIPLAEIVDGLDRMCYRGWLCLESEKRWRQDAPEPEIALPAYVDWMKRFDAARADEV